MKFKKILTTGKVWITSDTHFSHKNLVRGITNWRTQDGQIPINSTRDLNNRGGIQDKFLSVQHYLEVNIDGYNFVLCHYPLQSWHGLNKGVIHLHGHVHLGVNKKFGNGKKMDVGVDGNYMKPYSISEIIKIMDNREIFSDIDGDHHLDGLVGIVG
jgi:calcineurin-like phosphoesterase family protein